MSVFVWVMVGFVWLIVLVNIIGESRKPLCPKCRGRVPIGATRCIHCGTDFHEPTRPA